MQANASKKRSFCIQGQQCVRILLIAGLCASCGSGSGLREGPGFSAYDLHLMRERYVQPPLDKSGLPSSTDYLIQRIQMEATEMRHAMDEAFLECLRSSESPSEEQVDPDQAASTPSKAQTEQDQIASLGQSHTESDNIDLMAEEERKRWVAAMRESVMSMHRAMEEDGSIQPLPQSSQAQSQETPADQMRRLLGFPPRTNPRRQMRQELQPAEYSLDTSRSSSYSSLASFTSQLPDRAYLKSKAAALCRACAEDIEINFLKKKIAPIAAQLKKDPDNAALKATLQELLNCLHDNRLYKELQKLEAVAIALREEAKQQGNQAEVDAIDEEILKPLKEVLSELPTTLEKVAKGSGKE